MTDQYPDEQVPATRLAALRAALVDSAGLDSLPDPEPLIDGVLFRDSLAWLYGKPGHGKSFVALDWAGCVGGGIPWHGREVIAGPVLYIVAEGVAGLRQRVRAWEKAANITMHGVVFLPLAVQLPNLADLTALIDLTAELKPALVVIDTQARTTVGADENSAKDMGRIVAALDEIRGVSRACVLLVHHEARGGDNIRGSTALEGAADTTVRVTKDGPIVRLDNTKQKNAAEFPPILLRLVPYADSAVLQSHHGVGLTDELARSEQAILAVMRDSFGTTGASSSTLRDAVELPKSSYYRALNALVARGLLRNVGTTKRPFYVLPGSEPSA